jgi:glycosyltransferase involved in cell wall biosynthesis
MRLNQHRILAAIPCYNEERFIGSVILKVREHVDQVIVVDDGSNDATPEIAEAAGALVERHKVNQGKGVAVNTAFNLAREMGADALVLLDGDGQHDPTEIPLLLHPVLEDEADVVIGSRFLRPGNRIPKYRTIGQRILTFTTNLGSSVCLTDSQSGLRAFSRRAIELLFFNHSGLSVESEMQFLIKENNLRVAEVPITAKYPDRAKRSPAAHGFGVLGKVLGLSGRRRPLLFFGLPGAITLAFGVGAGFLAVQAPSIGYSLISVLLGVSGTLALFTGVMLHSMEAFTRKGGSEG